MSRPDLDPEPLEPGEPNLPVPAVGTPAPHELRASHEDRDAVVEHLRVAAGDGRLTAEELDERLGTALTARTYGELAVLLQDLPATATAGAPAGVRPGAEPAPEVTRMQARHSSMEKTGPWLVPLRLEVEAQSANAVVDLTRAVVRHPVLELEVALHSSSLRLVVPPGVVVEVDDLEVHSSTVKQRAEQPTGAPVVLLVRVSGRARSSTISVRGPHEGFWTRRRRRRAARRALTA